MHYKQDYVEYLHNQGKYDFAIIDPPWAYDNKPPRLFKDQLNYNLWDNDQGLKSIFNSLDCDYIFMWVTNSFIPNVILDSIETNFKYKTLLTWVKQTSRGNIAYGLGNTFRNCTEHLMVLQRVSKPLNTNIRNVVLAPSGKRTVKPKEFEKNLVGLLRDKGMRGIYIYFQAVN